MLGLMGGAKTEGPTDLSQILYKRVRIEGVFALTPSVRPKLTLCLQERPFAPARSNTRRTSCRSSPRRRSTKSLRAATATMDSTS